jgi:hypothetical protein
LGDLLVSLLLLALLGHLLALLGHLLALLGHLLALLGHLLVSLLLLALWGHLLALLWHLLVSLLLLALLLGWKILISRRQLLLLLWGLLVLSLLLWGLVILLGVWWGVASHSPFLSLRCKWMALLGWASRKVQGSLDMLIGWIHIWIHLHVWVLLMVLSSELGDILIWVTWVVHVGAIALGWLVFHCIVM